MAVTTGYDLATGFGSPKPDSFVMIWHQHFPEHLFLLASSQVGLMADLLDLLHRERRLSGQLARPGQRGVE